MAERGTYLTIADEIVRLIDGGDWAAGAPVPSEAALRERFGVARGTIRAALQVVEDRGLIDVRPGRGRFVAATSDGSQSADTAPTASYEIVAKSVQNLIDQQELPPHASLPSEAVLMAEHDVSRTTVRRAYRYLQEKGVVYVRQGAGAYVAEA